MAAELLKRHLAAVRLDRLVAAAAQIDDDEAADVGFIFQNQYLFHSCIYPPTTEPELHSVYIT